MTPAENMIQILVVDEHEVVRVGVKALLAGSEIKVTAEATTGKAAVKLTLEKHIDLVLLGLRLPDIDGLTVLGRIKLDKPELPVVLFSAFDNRAAIAKAIALGASGYLSQGCSTDELLATIRAAAAGDNAWGNVKVRRIFYSLQSEPLQGSFEASLTKRENDVIQQIVRGLSNKTIAGNLKISAETVKEHVQSVLRKLGLRDRTQAALWALKNGLA